MIVGSLCVMRFTASVNESCKFMFPWILLQDLRLGNMGRQHQSPLKDKSKNRLKISAWFSGLIQ